MTEKKEKKAAKTIEERVAKLERFANDTAGWRRRISENWKKFCLRWVGNTDDGKLSGRVTLAGVVLTFVIGIGLVASLYARDIANWPSATGYAGVSIFPASGEATVNLSVSGIISGATVVATSSFIGATTGDVTADDINANGSSISDRLGINLAAITTSTVTNYGTINIDIGTASNKVADTKAAIWGITAKDDLNGANTYAQWEYVTEDVTATTEDGGVRLKVLVGGAARYVMTVNSNQAGNVVVFPGTLTVGSTSTFTGKSTHTGGADMGDVTVFNVGNIFLDSIAADGGSSIVMSNTVNAVTALQRASKGVVTGKDTSSWKSWIGEIKNTAAGTNKIFYTTGLFSVTNDMVLVGQYNGPIPTTETNGIIRFSGMTTNSATVSGNKGEVIKVFVYGR